MNSKIPTHLAIIMDGNRRWARARGLSSLQGHQAGYEKLKEVGDWCLAAGIKYFTVYAFSTENWKRSKGEVSYLMRLLKRAVTKELGEFMDKNICLRIIGRKKGLSPGMQKAIKKAEETTKNNTAGVLTLAINYGGRTEIVDAAKKIIKRKGSVNEKNIAKNLYAPDIPDPDFIIRTSGEQRLSGFLLWQGSYAELHFIKKHWPGFTKKDFNEALKDYARRQRRFGGN